MGESPCIPNLRKCVSNLLTQLIDPPNPEQAMCKIVSAMRMNAIYFRNQARQQCRDVAALMAAEVHPANLGMLPPSPTVLVYKAAQVGLISSGEAAALLNKAQFS